MGVVADQAAASELGQNLCMSDGGCIGGATTQLGSILAPVLPTSALGHSLKTGNAIKVNSMAIEEKETRFRNANERNCSVIVSRAKAPLRLP